MTINRYRIKYLFSLACCMSLACAALRGGEPVPGYTGPEEAVGCPETVAAGFRLPPRRALVPYPSRGEALAGAATSSYVISLQEWKRDTVPAGIRYTARFKVRYAWDNRAVLLRTEDVPSSFGVEVNGTPVGYSQAGMGRTEFDITDFVQTDYNTVSVIVCEEPAAAHIGEGYGRRADAWRGTACVLSQPAVRIHDIFVETSSAGGEGYAALDVVTRSILLNPKEYVIHYELLDPAGEVVAMSQKSIRTGMLSRDTARFTVRVPDPLPWNHETPNRYTLLVSSQNEGRFLEHVAVHIGFRTPGFVGGSMTVDGLPATLRAVRYAAGPDEAATEAELVRFREGGYNCIVADGAPQPDYLYALCDSLGMYVCDAAAIWTGREPARITVGGNPSNNPEWKEAYIDRIHRMYYSSHLHPSVVMYSPARDSRNGYCLYEGYMELKRIAPGVPVFYEDAGGEWNNDLDSAAVFGKPDGRRPAGRVSVSLDRAGGCEADVTNNRELSAAKGTYEVTLRAGAKTLWTASGDFGLMGGGTLHVPIPLPASGMRRGSVQVEVHVLKDAAAQMSEGRGKVSDLYETVKVKFPL